MKPRKNYNKQQNLEFYEFIKSLKMTDKEINERKQLLNGEFESRECAEGLTILQRKRRLGV